MPRRMALSAGRVITLPSAVTIQAFDEAPSVTKPSWSTNQASRAPCSRAACLASTLGSSATDLMSTRAQRLSGTVMTATPFAASRSPRDGSMAARGDDDAGRRIRRRKRMIAPRHAACHLQIDDPVGDVVARDGLVQHDRQRRRTHRRGDLEFVQRARAAAPYGGARRSAACPHLADFVDAVGELIAAILDVNRSRRDAGT